jgi:CCR4-NOT transcriptional complex subunit CAF120
MRPYSGDPYGGQQQYPYGMPPMMMGMPQMQMPYGVSHPLYCLVRWLTLKQGYQGGYNPYAQQQAMMAAQMAYQQAMMMAQQQHPPSHHGGGGGGSQAGGHTPERSSSPPTVPGPPGAGYGYPSPHLGPYGWPGMMPPPAWGGGSPGLGVPGPGTPGQGWYPPQPPYQQQQQDGGSMRSGRASMYSDDGRGRSSDKEKEGGREREPAN